MATNAPAKCSQRTPTYPIIIKGSIKIIIFPLTAAVLLAALFCVSPAFAEEKPLNLNGAIVCAFQNNKDIQMQEQEVNAAQANILDARSRFMPTVNLGASYTRNDKVMAENIFTGYSNDNQIGVGFEETLYSGGANMANFKQAGVSLQVQQETLRAKKLDVEFEAKRLYYGLLLAYETQRIAREALDQAKAHYAAVQNKYDQGTSSRLDLLQSGVQVSLLVPELVRATNEIAMIEAELSKLAGFKIGTAITVSESLSYVPLTIKEEEFLVTAYLQKPEIILKSLGIDFNAWSVQMAKSGYRPQVTVQGDYSYRSDNAGDMFDEEHANWNLGVAVKVPLFEGFSTQAKVAAAKARYAEARLDKENLSEQIAVDVRRACLGLKEAEAVINSQKDNIEEAREALRIAEISYDAGVSTNLDVLDAQVSLSQI